MSINIFNDLEAIKLAIAIEERGERFYRQSAPKASDGAARVLLERLAEDEKEHKAVFEGLYQEFLKNKDEFDDEYLYDQDVAAYFNALAHSLIFPNEEEQARVVAQLQSLEDVIRFGIQAEKDSILLYTQMIISSKLSEAKDVFRRLLKEEKKHLVDLQAYLKRE
ncbi:ferritin family protein [Caldicoprobacter algeriensis]|uniref:ferritin family protein n=1 Tax=Caldicoprobacter algeriensis TaxID=699281 RepID=UPI00207AFD0D|nr:ferritin family protein [Caldicoprobacter algeriensis]